MASTNSAPPRWLSMLCACSYSIIQPSRCQVWCGHESGMVSVMDSKAGGRRGKQEHHAMHSGKVRSVSACPSDPNLLATASHDCTVRLWDVRKLPGRAATKSGELMEWRHGKGVNFASWAPISGSHIVSTSTDDTLRILSGFKGGSGKGSPVEKVAKPSRHTHLSPYPIAIAIRS
jgi:WD40 repeat protein